MTTLAEGVLQADGDHKGARTDLDIRAARPRSSDAPAFTEACGPMLASRAAAVDAGYPDNADLVIDAVTGVPSLEAPPGR